MVGDIGHQVMEIQMAEDMRVRICDNRARRDLDGPTLCQRLPGHFQPDAATRAGDEDGGHGKAIRNP